MKGVSPLIASVLLIVFTIIIAAILANFASDISRQQLGEAAAEADCIGALDISLLRHEGGDVGFRIRNTGKVNLTTITAAIEFEALSENEIYTGFLDPDWLNPGQSEFATIPLGTKTTSPTIIEVTSAACPRNSAVLNFR